MQAGIVSVPAAQKAVRAAAARNGLGISTWITLMVLLVGFVLLMGLLPLGSAVKIGADEDFELSKAVLSAKGYHLYTEVWNDQPPLLTFILTGIWKHVTTSIAAPRLLTVLFSAGLLCGFFLMARRISGVVAAGIATAMLIGSPGFIELSSSCMQENLALAPIVLSLCLLVWRGGSFAWVCAAGAVFGIGLQMKLIGGLYLPLTALVIMLRGKPDSRLAVRQSLRRMCLFGIAAAGIFVALNVLTGSPLLLQMQQSWSSHFSSATSYEYGSPTEKAFDWGIVARNWDTTVPALIGVVLLLLALRRNARLSDNRSPDSLIRDSRFDANNVMSRDNGTLGGDWALLPLAWLALTFVVFPMHKPWWAYYYVHNAIPLCWCAGIALATGLRRMQSASGKSKIATKNAQNSKGKHSGGASRFVIVAVCGLGLAGWIEMRLYLEITGIRNSPRLDSCLVLKEINRFKPYTRFLFPHDTIYSFHSGIPVPPRLAMLSLKRFWSGDMTQARLRSELEKSKPELILLPNSTEEVAFQDLVNREYRMVYDDPQFRLFAHRSISKKGAL